ncbi:MAG: SMI1/KNR4 family protein [Pseudomonadota bacterium]
MSDKKRRLLQWTVGYTKTELERAQEKWQIQFPPDLLELLLERKPVFEEAGLIDWMKTPADEIEKRLRWPFEGLWFDVENAGLWLPAWGEKPIDEVERKTRLKEIVDAAPTLIPIFIHRYIPAHPIEEGNPVFSVWQSDIIYYGSNIENYFEVEFADGTLPDQTSAYKYIEFWSQFALGEV